MRSNEELKTCNRDDSLFESKLHSESQKLKEIYGWSKNPIGGFKRFYGNSNMPKEIENSLPNKRESRCFKGDGLKFQFNENPSSLFTSLGDPEIFKS